MREMPLLKADDIEVRVQSVSGNKNGVGAILLIYKDARVDMRILDEVFGIDNWQRTHEVINGRLFCNIDIWDNDKKQWVRKQDVGTESNTEKEKGQASDSFKRAATNVGIGRELYTAPFIYVKLENGEYAEQSGKYKSYAKFSVKDIGYNDRKEINKLVIVDNKGKERFTFGTKGKPIEPPEPPLEPKQPEGPKPKVIKVGNTTKLLTQKGYVSIATIDKEKLKKMYASGYYAEANAEIEKVLGGGLSKHDQEILDEC